MGLNFSANNTSWWLIKSNAHRALNQGAVNTLDTKAAVWSIRNQSPYTQAALQERRPVNSWTSKHRRVAARRGTPVCGIPHTLRVHSGHLATCLSGAAFCCQKQPFHELRLHGFQSRQPPMCARLYQGHYSSVYLALYHVQVIDCSYVPSLGEATSSDPTSLQESG